MENRPFLVVLAMVCVLVLLSAPVLMAADDAKVAKTQSSSDCYKGMKSSEKCCTPSPGCCPGVSKTSGKADLDTKTRQLKGKSSSEVSRVSLPESKSDD